LEGASRSDREAFILHALEGFSLDEIGVITDRNPEDVRSSIEMARQHLRHLAPLATRFKPKLDGRLRA
jgi:DNA-directed RNA polymerase specialized sigma24 family protein